MTIVPGTASSDVLPSLAITDLRLPTATDAVRLVPLAARDGLREGLHSHGELRDRLRVHYPGIPEDAEVAVATFRTTRDGPVGSHDG